MVCPTCAFDWQAVPVDKLSNYRPISNLSFLPFDFLPTDFLPFVFPAFWFFCHLIFCLLTSAFWLSAFWFSALHKRPAQTSLTGLTLAHNWRKIMRADKVRWQRSRQAVKQTSQTIGANGCWRCRIIRRPVDVSWFRDIFITTSSVDEVYHTI